MQCPKCRAPFGDFTTGDGLTLDLCPACNAVWFDAGELARMLGTAEDLPALDAVQDIAVETQLPCPRCETTLLVQMPYARGTEVAVATCATCQGTLSAMRDLAGLRALAANHPRAARMLARAPERSLAGGLENVARRFDDLHTLTVKQRRKWLEMLTGFEQTNEYNVIGNGMGSAFHVQEQSAGVLELLKRLLLGPWRPFVAHVEDLRRGTLALRLVRPFCWFFPELEVRDADGVLLATISRRWTWLHTRYEVRDGANRLLGEVRGKLWRPWTFELLAGDTTVAKVEKKWSGLVTEALSDADNFAVTFAPGAPPMWKPLGLAAAVLLDVSHFERSNG